MQPTLNPHPSYPFLLPAGAGALRAGRRQGNPGELFLLWHYSQGSQLHPEERADGFPGVHSSPYCCLCCWSPRTHLQHSLQVPACDDRPAAVPAKKELVRRPTKHQLLTVILDLWGLREVCLVSGGRWHNTLGEKELLLLQPCGTQRRGESQCPVSGLPPTPP